MHRPSRPEIITYAPDGSDPQPLGMLAPVSPPRYSFTLPGGCESLSCLLARSPRWRTKAIDPGRKVSAILGGSIVWRGRMLEPHPTDNGWELTAQGSGTYGALFNAVYTGAWASVNPDDSINQAITRGLDWINPGVGSPSGIFLGQKQDSGSIKIDDLLSQCCSKGGLTWQVTPTAKGNVLSVFTLPTVPNRYLISTDPVARTLGGDINRIHLRYQVTADVGPKTPATYALTSVSDTASINKHGVTETFEDLSSSGTLSAGSAQAVGNFVLSRYQRASFADPFIVAHGDLLNLGGQPTNLGAFYTADGSPMVCRALLQDYGLGGEVKSGAVTFLVGGYEYDAATGQASVTPFQALRTDFAGLMAMRVEAIVPRKPHVKRKRPYHFLYPHNRHHRRHKGQHHFFTGH